MSLVKGDNVLVYFYDGGLWKLYACGTACTLNVTTEFIETSVPLSGKNRTYRPTFNSFTGSISGLVHLNITNTLALPDLRAKQLNHEKLLMRFQRTANDGTVYTDECYVYIANSSDDAPTGGVNTFTIDLRGTGAITQIFTPTSVNPNGKVKRTSTWISTGGETSHVFSELIGKDIIEVSIDARDATKIITSGTPVDNEVKFTVASGTITFPYALNADISVYATYQDI